MAGHEVQAAQQRNPWDFSYGVTSQPPLVDNTQQEGSKAKFEREHGPSLFGNPAAVIH